MTSKKGDSYANINNYIRHYIGSTERGHIIKILTEDGLKTFDCKWKDYKRTKSITKNKT